MKTFKQILKEKGIEITDRIELARRVAKKLENSFKNKIRRICQTAGVDFREVKIKEEGKAFVLYIPLKKLIGPATRQFCANRWNAFFEQAGIQVDFRDNIETAINNIDVLVALKFDKNNFKEIT